MEFFKIDEDIAKAQTLNTDFYNSAICFEAAKEKIFSLSPQFIGDTDMVKEAGTVAPFTLLENYLDEPLILSKDKAGTIRCLSNVCTHRGNLLAEKACKSANLRCKYHGRMFGLDGKFISMPEFKEVKNFPTKDDDLKELKLFEWGKLLFTSLEEKIPAENFLKEMMERLSWLPIEEFSFDASLSNDYFVKANWALYCENYLEGFHIPFVHAGLNDVIDFGNYTTELFKYSVLQLGIAKKDEDCFDLPASSPDFGKNVAAYYYWVFPNMMFNFYPWGLSINIIKPVSVNETKVSFLTYVWKKEKLQKGAGADVHSVELEDEEVVENVQKGVKSRFYKHGRYSVNREQGTHHFHRLIADFMNK